VLAVLDEATSAMGVEMEAKCYTMAHEMGVLQHSAPGCNTLVAHVARTRCSQPHSRSGLL
jgi:hypothetical protein